MQKVWFITGASRGLGAEIAKAALAAGDRVVATGRDPDHVRAALSKEDDHLLVMRLDVTREAEVQAAVDAALQQFGRIDVLVNNAGYGHLGFFEEATAADVNMQFDSNVFGLMHVTRAVLPAMRTARAGRIFNLSSLAGMRGSAFSPLYCASKFAVEGFSEALAEELAPFGIRVTIIAPGPFRTDFLSARSLQVAGAELPDYAPTRDTIRATFEARNGRQAGDPLKLAAAVVELANHPHPPLRFVAGTAAFEVVLKKLAAMRIDIEAWRDRSIATDGDYEDARPWQPPSHTASS
ncbi:oxidoreductase [Cupriavidus sp. BIC8F]|uniref:oxidoreductase n=1 Tax=Cupriavidus sp. BIC8F TaxID=3079014 RepID=UPI0029166188|nr:oxidoreductase [Cupriavidus sp. BIC8F]